MLSSLFEKLGVVRSSSDQFIESLPFSCNDITAGSETELHTVVIGNKNIVDLPLSIQESRYFSNVKKREAAGEMPHKPVTDIESFINDNESEIWDNSWVRFPKRLLSLRAKMIFEFDLLADKKTLANNTRADADRFVFHEKGEAHIRVPVSYLLKLALADAVVQAPGLPEAIQKVGYRLLNYFINDNTSPEIHSFYVTPLWPVNGMGKAIARETSKRFLLTQLLVMYSNKKFFLKESGQRVIVFHSPHPPVRQKKLNECIPDSCYRELFMNPCLSGWDRGEDKHDYMHLCHQVLSRSQLNTIARLREAGIIVHNLVVLPHTSSICLSNNGVHLSIGSLKLTRALKSGFSGFTEEHEKYIGDLAVKIVEHFLPLFVGTYTAAPYRMDFSDFHPEKAMGFLPHELHYTHLRMMWRRWLKKAKLTVFGSPMTPFGPKWIDSAVRMIFSLKGDYIADYRLIDYLVCLLSTENSPALDGSIDNDIRLKHDLMHMGVFDNKMSLYLLYKQRSFGKMGFSGFEGRHYSLFESITEDMTHAANLQSLVTLLAYKYMATGKIDHAHVPDTPFIESERRQITFGAAIGIPTFFVKMNTGNIFLKKILNRTKRTRLSKRYPGYIRVYNFEYKKALVQLLEDEAWDIIEALELQGTITDLKQRFEHPDEHSAFGKLTKGILDYSGVSSPFKLKGCELNTAAEDYYRHHLRLKHLKEAFDLVKEDFRTEFIGPEYRQELKIILKSQNPEDFLEAVENSLIDESVSTENLLKVIYLILLSIHGETVRASRFLDEKVFYDTPSVYR